MSEKEEKLPPRDLKVIAIPEDELSVKQREDMAQLMRQCFSYVDPKEAKEDFYTPHIARVLAYSAKDLVGYAGIHKVNVEFERKKIKLGGFGGVCTRPDMRGKGIATSVCAEAMEILKEKGCDIAFLSIDLTKETDKLYKKFGFEQLGRKFSWRNIHGKLKSDRGGMISPVMSQELFKSVLKGRGIFYVGEGYW